MSHSLTSAENAAKLSDINYIIVLGAGLRSDGSPSDMLADRLSVGISLLEKFPDAMLILTGDNSGERYNEVAAMKKFATNHGVDEEKIIEDDCGFSTYESIYRAKNTFNVDKAIIVSQEYHLYRALYIARGLGIEAYGVESDYRTYQNQMKRELREILARFKDFVNTVLEPKPTYLGEPIDINGDGNVTNG
jgi:vancomycin permeability regulator SanA